MRIAYLDCSSGISGDMTLGALVDAGVPLDRLNEAIGSLGLPGVKLLAQEVKKHGFRAAQVTVEHEPEHKHRHLHHIEAMIDGSRLTGGQKRPRGGSSSDWPRPRPRCMAPRSRRSTSTKSAQSTRLPISSARPWAGTCSAQSAWSYRPSPRARAELPSRHGECNIPAPATAELLRGIPLAASDVQAELTTPTGAAIVATLATGFGPLPAMTIEKIGYGAGQRDLPQQANILRLLVGETADVAQTSDTIWVLETNLDDASGEVIGHCTAQLWDAGRWTFIPRPSR